MPPMSLMIRRAALAETCLPADPFRRASWSRARRITSLWLSRGRASPCSPFALFLEGGTGAQPPGDR
eukprot:9489862-Pyramimonas_sp.AAC.2